MTRLLAPPIAPTPTGRPAVPPLRNGDPLTVAEFERRYEAMPADTRAELIEGVVFMHPPVSLGWHGRPHLKWSVILGYYEGFTPGVIGGTDSTVRLDMGNQPQPDVCLLIDPALGGRATIDADQRVIGGPELVAEVSASTAAHDLHQKLEAYRRNGVSEYLVWRTLDRQFDHFTLADNGQYDRRPAADDGVIRSTLFPGLWVDTAALVGGNLPAAFATLTAGMATPAYAAFAADLARRQAARP